MIRPAEARRRASMLISIAIRLSLTGLQVDWTTKQSRPRTVSSIQTQISPSAKVLKELLLSSIPSSRQMSSARGRLVFPLNTLMGLPFAIMFFLLFAVLFLCGWLLPFLL